MGWREELANVDQGFTDAMNRTPGGPFVMQTGRGINNLVRNAVTNPREVAGEIWDAYSSTSPGLNIPGGGVPGSIRSGMKALNLGGLGRLQGVGQKMAGQFSRGVGNAIIDPRSDSEALTGLRDKFPEVVNALERPPINNKWNMREPIDMPPNSWGSTMPHEDAVTKNMRPGGKGRIDPTKPHWLVDEKKLEEITKNQAQMKDFAEKNGSPTLKSIVDNTEPPIGVAISTQAPADRQAFNTPLHEALHTLYEMSGKHGLVPEPYAQKIYMDAMKRAGHSLDYTTQLWDFYNQKGMGGVAHAAIEALTDAMMKKKGIPNPQRNF